MPEALLFLSIPMKNSTVFLSPWHFALACLAGWIHREQQQRIEYVQLELSVAKEILGTKRLRFTDDQRRRLAANAKQVGRKGLLEIGRLVTPNTLLRWHRDLIAKKWTFERKGHGRPPVALEIAALIVQFARKNPRAGYDRIQGVLANLGHEVGVQIECRERLGGLLKHQAPPVGCVPSCADVRNRLGPLSLTNITDASDSARFYSQQPDHQNHREKTRG